jgi:hypothetical protein
VYYITPIRHTNPANPNWLLLLSLTEWISHVLGPVGVWALTGHVALHSEALQGVQANTHSEVKGEIVVSFEHSQS